jgi:hypothetical protein
VSHQAPDTITITVDAPGVADIPPLDSVGYIYEIGINGVGYMLDDNPQDPESLPDVVVPSLDAPRLATTDTPFSQAVERYTFETFHDWTGGAGQLHLNRAEASTSRAFYDSEGVDPFTLKSKLGLLPATTLSLAETYAGLRVVVVGDDAYALTAADELTRLIGSTAVWDTPFTITDGDAVAVSDLASDGQYWYAATGEGIIRGTTSNPAANWSTQVATSCRWAAGRICAAVIASGSTPNRFTTLDETGAEELAGGHHTLDAGHTVVLGGAAAGHFYYGSYVGDRGTIWAWQLGVDSEGAFHAPFVAWDMPQGLIPVTVSTAGGEVWVRAYKAEGPSSGEVSIYRGVPGAALTPFKVADLGSIDREGDFTEIGDMVVFSYEDTAGDAALGGIWLPTGGYARWLLAHDAGTIRTVTEWQGREMFTVAGVGVFVRSLTTYEEAGWVKTSIVDGASLLTKVLDTLTIEAVALQTDQEVEVDYTTDASTYVSAGSLVTSGAQSVSLAVGVRTKSWGAQIHLRGDGTNRTEVVAVSGKYHPLGIRDQVIVLPVKAFDELTGLNGHPLPENAPGRGVEIYRTLLSFGQSRVLFQDADYHITGLADVWEVVSVRANRRAIFDPTQGHNVLSAVVELTLRKVWT